METNDKDNVSKDTTRLEIGRHSNEVKYHCDSESTARIGKVSYFCEDRDNGMYILAQINGFPIKFKLDTGSTVSIISK